MRASGARFVVAVFARKARSYTTISQKKDGGRSHRLKLRNKLHKGLSLLRLASPVARGCVLPV